MLRRALLVLAIPALGCSNGERVPAAPMVAATASANTTTPSTAAPVDEGELHATKLGERCRPHAPPTGADPGDLETCGRDRRLSIELDRFTAKLEPPCKLVEVPPPTPPRYANHTRRVCFADGRLYASALCTVCRVPNAGYHFVAELDDLTDAQALGLQSLLELPHETPLHGERAFRRALSLDK